MSDSYLGLDQQVTIQFAVEWNEELRHNNKPACSNEFFAFSAPNGENAIKRDVHKKVMHKQEKYPSCVDATVTLHELLGAVGRVLLSVSSDLPSLAFISETGQRYCLRPLG